MAKKHGWHRGHTLQSFGLCLAGLSLAGLGAAGGQGIPSNNPERYGPYNGQFLSGGLGLRKPLKDKTDTVLLPASPWTMSCWYNSRNPPKGLELLAGMGDVTGEYPRFLAVEPGRVVLWDGAGNQLSGEADTSPGTWHFVAASFDGTHFHLFSDGKAVASGSLALGTASPVLQLAPERLLPAQGAHFGGEIAG